jgi:hypothetical protein
VYGLCDHPDEAVGLALLLLLSSAAWLPSLLPVKLRIFWPMLMLNRLSVAARRAVVGQEHGPAWAEGRYSVNQLHGFLTVWTIGWRMTVHGAEDRHCKGMCNSGSLLQPSKRVLCVLNFGGAGRYGSSCVGRYCIGP